jgi:uncharacterized iron-regulated membrane protein
LAAASGLAAAHAAHQNAWARGRLLTIVWLLLGILAIFVMGLGLLLWAIRRARRVRHLHTPQWTHMPDIWYLNPPDKKDGNEP